MDCELGESCPIPWHDHSKRYDAVVAIDFGTTFSGFAYCCSNDGDGGIYENRKWGNEKGYTSKTATCVLLKPNKELQNFGYEAAEKYAELTEDWDKSYYFFRRFKMLLYGREEELNRNTLLTAMNGEDLPALDVFAKSLEYLKDKALTSISEKRGRKSNTSKIRWVVTVPAIWKDSAKQFMREAAYKAGIGSSSNPRQLIIALEPEAAAVYCRQLQLKEFVDHKGKGENKVKDTVAPPKTQYLVIDSGGGTVDVTAHEIEENDNIKEIYHASGNDYGGTKVDEKFENLLEQIFKKKLLDNFRRNHHSDWLDLMNDFEIGKRADRVNEGKATRISLPESFIKLIRLENGTDDDNRSIRRLYKPEEVKIARGHLSLGPEMVKSLFEPAISSIISHLKRLLNERELRDVQLLFLVGGFSESCLLQKRIREEFRDNYKILIPKDAQTAVMKGAVMFGKRPGIVVERCLAATYGTNSYVLFDSKVHKGEKLEYVEGKATCKDIFSVLARENEKVRNGQCKKTSGYKPLRKNQTEVGFTFFTSTKPDVLYIDDEGVEKLPGYISVKSPDTSKGTDREVEVRLYFETEIRAVGVDLTTGNEASTSINFLYS